MSENNVWLLNKFREAKREKGRGWFAGGGDGGAYTGLWRCFWSLPDPGSCRQHPSLEKEKSLELSTCISDFYFQGNKGVEENNVRNQYSIPGILHFIQHEWARCETIHMLFLIFDQIWPCCPYFKVKPWKKLILLSRFEMERSQWEVEKAELQARIAFLQGEH